MLVPRHRKRGRAPSNTKEPKKCKAFEERDNARQRLRDGLSVLGAPESLVELRRSPIHGHGVFVCADAEIKAGQPITEYCGELVTYDEAEDRPFSHLRTHARRRWAIDGTRLPDGTAIDDPQKQLLGHGIGAFANHAVREQDRNAVFDFIDTEYNERAFERFAAGATYDFDPAQRVTILRAWRDIGAGEEVLVDYGRDYRGFDDKHALRAADASANVDV